MKNIKTIPIVLLTAFVFIHGTGVPGITKMSGVKKIKGATVESVQKEKPLQSVGPYSSIIIGNFKASDEYKNKYKDGLRQFRQALIYELRNKKIFAKIIDGNSSKSSGKALMVTGEVVNMNIVDTTARKLKGAWAGKSYMDIYLKLADASSGKTLHEIIIGTYNNPVGAAWSGASTDQSMPSDMGNIISAYLATVIPAK